MRQLLITFLLIGIVKGYSQNPLYEKGITKKVMNYQEVDQRALHFGFGMGLNSLDFVVKPSLQGYLTDSLVPDVTLLHPGFHVNIVSNWRLANNLALRVLPGLVFGQRNIVYWKYGSYVDKDMKLESNMIDVPILLKYKAKRINNSRPYIIFGGNLRYDLAAKKKFDEKEEVFVRIKRLDYFYEIGFGIDFYNQFFKFSTELKYSAGIRDIKVNSTFPRYPQYANAIDKIFSSGVFLTLSFE